MPNGRGRAGGGRFGPPRACKCPVCGKEFPKVPGKPCRSEKCPDCGVRLIAVD
nr:hypothetical protein [Methanothermus fervidus]